MAGPLCVCARVCNCCMLNLRTSAYASVAWKFQMNIAGRMFAFVHGCVCLCVCVCLCACVRVMQYQSHSPQSFVQGNDRERVPGPLGHFTLPLS